MRLFIAIDLSSDLRQILLRATDPLKGTAADVRWVPPENLHITLKFLAEVDEQRLPELLQRIKNAAAQVPVFPLEIEGLERLPEKGPARIIMCRVISPDQRIIKLHRLLDSTTAGMGLPLDTRAYVPHLTLARISHNTRLNRLLRLVEKHNLDFFGTFNVEAVTLYQSTLGGGQDGAPRYTPLGHASLSRPVQMDGDTTLKRSTNKRSASNIIVSHRG